MVDSSLHDEEFELTNGLKKDKYSTEEWTYKAEKILNFKSKWSLTEGIKDYFIWLNETGWG